ncbi:P-loop containing nucleoside triphosphate hydrolase protein, partial [Pilobolus umbonatus]
IRPKLNEVMDAVEQARFNEKKWVWVEDSKEGYVRGHVTHEGTNTSEIEYEFGGTASVNNSAIMPMNPPKFDMVDDMADLTHLNEPSVIHNLSVRYKNNHIYTYSGLFLVAVNPYRSLPIYSETYIQNYKGKRRGELPPHIYAVADQAYHDMLQDNENQSILITGESGAGKTENTKIVIQYLTAVANNDIRDKYDKSKLNTLQTQILQANPVLESFGNAQTIRNNNSSRFGKFIRIEFNTRAQICSANIEWYLLEKSRVHQQTSKERNYHIFYQLLEADEDMKKQLLLDGNANDYNFLKHSNKKIDGIDDRQEYEKLMKSLTIMGLSSDEVFNLFRLISSILHLGNISITNYRDRADIKDYSAVERVCHLLGISAEEFKKSLLSPRIKAGRDWVIQAKSPEQVMTSLDALAKTLYERNFASLVERVNEAIDGHSSKDKLGFIGVLDIAGFEIFESNSFEQLCINYTNEKLQQFFNQNMFELEQEEYKKEKIDWDYIDFGKDLQPTIDLIEKTNPVGILSCLEEECVAPRGSDQRFLEKLNRFCDKDNPDAKYKSTRFRDGFVLKHYAGDVEYSVDGWIEKNKDPLNEDITRLLAKSTHKYVATLFEDYLSEKDDTPSHRKLDLGSFRTVGQRHKQQLLSLMNTLYMTHPHFVRCILPNSRKYPGEIEIKLILDQLRCNGVLEGIRICRKGFPNRLSFDEFRKRYQIFCPDLLDRRSFIDGKTSCQMLVNTMKLEKDKFQIGSTKVFFKATVLAELEEQRDSKLGVCMTQFQAFCRGMMARQFQTRFSRQTDAIRIMQRNARIYVTLREWPWWRIYAKLKPLNEAYRIDVQIQEQEQKINQLETQLREQSDTLKHLKAQNKKLTDEHADYKELILADQSVIRELEEGKENLMQKFTLSEERIEELEYELRKKSDDFQQQEDAHNILLDTHRKDSQQYEATIKELKKENIELSDNIIAYSAEKDEFETKLKSMEKDYALLSSDMGMLKSESTAQLDDYQKKERKWREETARHEQQLNDFQKKENVWKEEIARWDQQLNEKLQQISRLEDD